MVTIAAKASLNSSAGLVASSSQRKQLKAQLVKTRCHRASRNLNGYLYFGENNARDYYERGPLGQCGWALQEEILSPRVLYFTKNLIFWRCIGNTS